jgi:hypothetical protein
MVIKKEGTLHFYYTPSSPEYSHVGENDLYTLVESHIDRKGSYYYKVKIECPYVYSTLYALFRIDPSRVTLEFTLNDTKYPSSIDSKDFSYRIYTKM